MKRAFRKLLRKLGINRSYDETYIHSWRCEQCGHECGNFIYGVDFRENKFGIQCELCHGFNDPFADIEIVKTRTIEPEPRRNPAQYILDSAENFCTRHRWIAITFWILWLKRKLGLRYHR